MAEALVGEATRVVGVQLVAVLRGFVDGEEVAFGARDGGAIGAPGTSGVEIAVSSGLPTGGHGAGHYVDEGPDVAGEGSVGITVGIAACVVVFGTVAVVSPSDVGAGVVDVGLGHSPQVYPVSAVDVQHFPVGILQLYAHGGGVGRQAAVEGEGGGGAGRGRGGAGRGATGGGGLLHLRCAVVADIERRSSVRPLDLCHCPHVVVACSAMHGEGGVAFGHCPDLASISVRVAAALRHGSVRFHQVHVELDELDVVARGLGGGGGADAADGDDGLSVG